MTMRKIFISAALSLIFSASAFSQDWKPVDTSDLYVKAGTALDLTPFADRSEAGSYGRLIVNEKGELVFEKRQSTPVRFMSLQLMPSPGMRFWSDDEVRDFADAIARQGYNLVRYHFLDNYLCAAYKGAALKAGAGGEPVRYKLPQSPEGIKFDPKALDRISLLWAELKKRGVYMNLDWMTSFAGYTDGKIGSADKRSYYNTKVQLFINPEFRENWKAGAKKLLDYVNPYTGIALRNDPAIAFTSCLNEQEILFPFRDYGKEFDSVWKPFLAKKYASYSDLYKAWGGKCGKADLKENGTFEDVPSINAEVLKDSLAARDMAECCAKLEYEMSEFYIQALNDLGFEGLTSNWNMRTRLCTVPARSLFPVITMNCYHAHPEYGKNTKVHQQSSLASGGSSFKNQTMARFLDRPFINTEFGHVFWNRYRHEQGILFGAGAALQDWSALTCHAHQVIDSAASVNWFEAGADPVIRASETLEMFAFLRRDVTASENIIEVPVTDKFIYDGRGMKTIDDELSRLWVLCRSGITYGPKRVDYKPVLSITPDKTSAVGGSMWFTSVEDSSSTGRMSAVVKALREKSVLDKSNISDPSKGILQSDTGEIVMDTSKGGEMFVTTQRLEAAAVKRDREVKLGAMTIKSCNVPASVAMVSLDSSKSLKDSSKLLLIFATDARNSNMKFTDATEEYLVSIGNSPIVVMTGKLEIALERSDAKAMKAYALKFNGERAEEIPVSFENGKLTLSLDTARLEKAGPVPFFEIVKD